jgi:hypothetical protein
MAHALTSLRIVNQGRYTNEIIEKVYDVSMYSKPRFQGFYKDRVVIITNKAIMFITDTRKLQRRIVLNDIKGMMFYFQNQKYNAISVETEKEIISIQTNLPEINKRILKDLKAKLEQLEELVVQQDH